MAFLDLDTLPHDRMIRLEDERRLRNLGVLSLCCFFLPVAAGLYGGIFAWDLLPSASTAEMIRLFSPVFFGVGLLVLSVLHRLDRLVTGITTLVLLIISAIFFTESELAYTDLFTGMIGFVGRRPLTVLVGFSLVAIGADLRVKATAGLSFAEEGAEEEKGSFSLKRVANVFLLCGGLLLCLLYGLDQRGRPFLLEIVDLFEGIRGTNRIGEMMGGIFTLTFQLVPVLIAIWALIARRRPDHVGLLASAARYTLPGLIILFSYRLFQQGFHADIMLMQLKAAALIAVFTGTCSMAIGAIVVHLFNNPLPEVDQASSSLLRDQELRARLRAQQTEGFQSIQRERLVSAKSDLGREVHPVVAHLMALRVRELLVELELDEKATLDAADSSRLLVRLEGQEKEDPEKEAARKGAFHRFLVWMTAGSKRLAGAGIVLLAFLMSLAWLNQYTPQPDLTWDLRKATAEEEAFFSRELPNYVYLRSRRKALVAAEVSEEYFSKFLSEEYLDDKRDEVLSTAADISSDLEEEVLELFDALDTVDVEGRRWYAAIRPINERIRKAGMPFYLKGAYKDFVPEGEMLPIRMYFLGSYHVKDVRHYTYDGREYGAIHARKSGNFYEAGLPLGFTHPDEPFALIMVDEVAEHVDSVVYNLNDDGTCGLSKISNYSAAAIDVDILCGALFVAAFQEEGIDVRTSPQARDQLVRREIISTEIHEIQHQIDGNDIEIPGQLFRLIPIASERQLARAAYEISAYLTELSVGDPLSTLSVLTSLSTHLMTEEAVHTPYRYAAGIILSELTGHEIIRSMGKARNFALLDAWKTFADKGDDLPEWVSERARDLHEELLGTPAAIPSRIFLD